MGTFTTFSVPAAGAGPLQGTVATSINAGGVVAGIYLDAKMVGHGFVRAASGTITTFDAPDAGTTPTQGTFPVGINASGEITGMYFDNNNAYHGFVRTADGTLTEFDVPSASTLGHRGTTPLSINTAGDVTGTYSTAESGDTNAARHGFVRAADGTITTFDVPGAGTLSSPGAPGTIPLSINAAGDIAGWYGDANGVDHGFLRTSDGTITAPIDVPGAGTKGSQSKLGFAGTIVTSIDAAGDIAGAYTDANGVRHAFVRAVDGTMIYPIDVPGVGTAEGLLRATLPISINTSGVITGLYQDTSGVVHGFLRTANGEITAPLDAPGAGTEGSRLLPGTGCTSINDSGAITGAFTDANSVFHGFVVNTSELPPAATPTFSPVPGSYVSAQTVTISDATAGATIYYTTNGTDPTASSTLYTGPIQVSSSETIQAIAMASGYSASAIATATYIINGVVMTPAATPTFSPAPATYGSTQTVTISDATPGATIFYTTDGITPTPSSTEYTGPIQVTSTTAFEAIAVATGYSTSSVANAAYVIAYTEPGDWVWMAGSNMAGQPGVYGSLGTSAGPNVPGGRQDASNWIDGSGNLWLFGGQGYGSDGNSGDLNDLWQFNKSKQQWVWMGGSKTENQVGAYGTPGTPAAGNVPGARMQATGAVDASGNFWLFGGYGYDSVGTQGSLNDFWEFNPSTNQWTWMSGSSKADQPGVFGTLGTPAAGNVPGARGQAASWVDSHGNFWLFGGYGLDAYGDQRFLNDLWEFNITSRQWAWMGGSGTQEQSGVYGTLGTAAAGNFPGSRLEPTSWRDSHSNFWLFGGYGYDAGEGVSYLNDLWEFNPSTGLWAWMGGSSTAGQIGVYGTLGAPAAANVPGGRQGVVVWTDRSGNFWIFGGWGLASAGAYEGVLNDLWRFSPSTGQWAWMGGSSNSDANGVYGIQGTPASANIPGARSGGTSWTDGSGNFWLFGGDGLDSAGNWDMLNDLWEYQPSVGTVPQTATPTFSPPAGHYASPQTVTISDTAAGATIYYTTNGTTPTTSSTQYTGPITVSSTETIEAIATASGYSTSPVASATYTIAIVLPPPAATPKFSPPAGTYASAQTVTISDATAGATIYYTTNGTIPTTGSTRYSGPLTVSSTETIEAIATASGYVTSIVAVAAYTISSSPPPPPLLAAPSAGSSYYGMYCNTCLAASFTLNSTYYVSTIDVVLITPATTSFTTFDFSLQSSLTAPVTTIASEALTAPLGEVSTEVMNVNKVLPAGTYYLVGNVPGYFGTTVTADDVDGWMISTGASTGTAGSVTNGLWAWNGSAWTLESGNYSGNGTMYYAPAFSVNGSPVWRQVPGSLSQISVGSDGTVWGINSAGQASFFNPQTQSWQQVLSSFTQIVVGSSGFVWGLNSSGQVYRYDPASQNWDLMPGALSQIAVGSDGDVWGINSASQVLHFDATLENWVQIPGALAQIAVGFDGAVWGLNATGQVFRFNPGIQSFQQIPGALARIAVGADGDMWGLNAAQQIFRFNPGSQSWQQIPGLLKQLVVGSGSNVWGLNAGGQIFEFNPSIQGWQQMPGVLAQIAVGADGAVWGLNSADQIFEFVQPTQATQTFHQMAGTFAQIAAGLDGEVWALNAAQQIWRFDVQRQSWEQIPGVLTQIRVGFGGNVWGLNAAGQICRFVPSTQGWQAIPGVLAQLEVGADGSVWGLNSGNEIFRFNAATQGWQQIPGLLAQIAVGSASNVWGLNAAGQIFRYNAGQQAWVSVPGELTSLEVAFDGTVWGLNSANQIFRYNAPEQNWILVPGQLSQISVGADAVVWGLSASGQTCTYW